MLVWISATTRRCILHFLQMYFAREEIGRGSKGKKKPTKLFSFFEIVNYIKKKKEIETWIDKDFVYLLPGETH